MKMFFVFALFIGLSSFAQKLETPNISIESLRLNTTPLSSAIYYTTNRGQEGFWYYDATDVTSTDNTGTILVCSNGKRFKRVYSGSVDPKWFGCKGDGVTDDSPAFQAAVNLNNTNAFNGGVDILIPKGTYLLKDIVIGRGVKIYAEQTARNNSGSYVPVRIAPASGATNIFYFSDSSMNSEIRNLFIGAYGNTTLNSAIRFTGYANRLEGNMIDACPKYGVYVQAAGGSYIVDNTIAGWAGVPPTFSGLNDFRGALHIITMGDSWITGNEISASEPYLTGQVPTPIQMLRDSVNRRICAVAATELSTSVISDNIFENGDRGVVILGGLYSYFSGNRYEMNGGGGLLLKSSTAIAFKTFVGERFLNNSLAVDGGFDDIEISGVVGQLSFISPIFELITIPPIPTSNYKVRYNISSQVADITLVSPQFHTAYYSIAPINSTPGFSIPKQAMLQTNPDNPTFTSISSSVLNVTSTTNASIPASVMTSVQKTRIANPTAGMTVYCSDCVATDRSMGVMQTYNGSQWKNHW